MPLCAIETFFLKKRGSIHYIPECIHLKESLFRRTMNAAIPLNTVHDMQKGAINYLQKFFLFLFSRKGILPPPTATYRKSR